MTTNYASLVNETHIRASIKRLFSNEACEILAELFQNSQRAGATEVRVTVLGESLTIEDDGHGVQGLDGLHALLRMAESNYQDAAVASNQHPMGLGIHALFAHDQVTTVVLRSGHLTLAIDTQRWWDDPAYYQNWPSLVVEHADAMEGLSISAYASAKFVSEVVGCLPVGRPEAFEIHGKRPRQLPASGYEGRLGISLNGKPVYTAIPASWRGETILETTYQGAPLIIQRHSSHGKSLVNWYGQLVEVSTAASLGLGLDFYLEVNSGRPINLKSPVRAGVIIDEAYVAFLAFIKETVVRYACTHPAPVVQAVQAAYCYDAATTQAHCPFFVVCPLVESDDDPTRLSRAKACLDRYDAPEYTLFDERVQVQVPGKTDFTEYSEGFVTFVKQFELPAASWEAGDKSRVPRQTLWWKPGGELQHGVFVSQGGHWLVTDADRDEEPSAGAPWEPVPDNAQLAAFDEYEAYDASDVSGVILASDPVAFLVRGGANCYFRADDSDRDRSTEDFTASVAAWRRQMLGQCVGPDWTLADLQAHVPAGVRILAIAPAWSPKGFHPESLKVATSDGAELELRIA